MALTRLNIPAHLEKGLNTIFGMAYSELPKEWSYLFDTEKSSKAFEEDLLTTGLGMAPVKAEGANVAEDRFYEGWKARYVHQTIALSFAITKEAMQDDLYKRQAPKNTRALARSLGHTKEARAAAILNNGFTAAYAGGDGKPLFADDHPTIFGGDQSNVLATPADLSEASLEDMLIAIRTAKDDRNLHIALQPKRLVVPPAAEYEAIRILASTQRVGTDHNDINAIRNKGVLSTNDLLVMTRLADDGFWMIKTDAPDGLKHMDRQSVEYGMDNHFRSGNLLYKADERYSFGWTDWRGAFASTGT